MVYVLLIFDMGSVSVHGPFGKARDAGNYAKQLGIPWGGYGGAKNRYYLVRTLKRVAQ